MILARVGDVAVILDGPLSPAQRRRVVIAWARVERFLAPALHQVLTEALEVDVTALEPAGLEERRATTP